MKIVCIYHRIDLDGQMSAAIVKHWFNETNFKEPAIGNTLPDNIDFIGFHYGDPIPDLSEYDKVIMCDISFPKEEMYSIYNKLHDNFIWIDHHISAINDNVYIDDNICKGHKYNGVRDINFAACELTWKYFFPNDTMPEIVKLLGRYDCFGHKGTDEEQKVLEFQYGARQSISNYEEAYEYLKWEIRHKDTGNSYIDRIHDTGKSIYGYLCTEAKQAYENGFNVILKEPNELVPSNPVKDISRNFICINKERVNPINFGIDYHKDGYDGCACFHYANGIWNFSLYNDNGEVDCSVIAKQYGGGGHKGAAGFRLNNEQLNELMN